MLAADHTPQAAMASILGEYLLSSQGKNSQTHDMESASKSYYRA